MLKVMNLIPMEMKKTKRKKKEEMNCMDKLINSNLVIKSS